MSRRVPSTWRHPRLTLYTTFPLNNVMNKARKGEQMDTLPQSEKLWLQTQETEHQSTDGCFYPDDKQVQVLC